MKILQLVTRRQRRGAEVFAALLSETLAARGHEVVFVGLYETPRDPLAPDKVRTVDLGVPSGRWPSLAGIRAVARLISAERPDIVQANGSDTLKYAVLARRFAGSRVPLLYRNISIVSSWIRGGVHRAWNRWLVGNLDQVVSVSHASSRDFEATFGWTSDRISVIPRAVRVPSSPDVGRARADLARLTGIPDGARIIMHIGSFTPEKNHDGLLDAFDRVRETMPDVHLVLVGDGPLAAEIGIRARESAWRTSIHMLGNRPDADRIVAAADLLVLTSRIEGIPGVVLEAAAQGIPAVATDVGGMREAIQDGVTGRMVPEGDMTAVALATIDLLRSDETRREMGSAARARMVAEFEIERVCARYEDLYRTLIERARPVGASSTQHE